MRAGAVEGSAPRDSRTLETAASQQGRRFAEADPSTALGDDEALPLVPKLHLGTPLPSPWFLHVLHPLHVFLLDFPAFPSCLSCSSCQNFPFSQSHHMNPIHSPRSFPSIIGKICSSLPLGSFMSFIPFMSSCWNFPAFPSCPSCSSCQNFPFSQTDHMNPIHSPRSFPFITGKFGHPFPLVPSCPSSPSCLPVGIFLPSPPVPHVPPVKTSPSANPVNLVNPVQKFR